MLIPTWPQLEIDTDHDDTTDLKVDIAESEVDTAESEPSDGRTMGSKCCWFVGMDVAICRGWT